MIEIEADDIKIVWTFDYEDGPISGICKYNKRSYFFNMEMDRQYDDIYQKRTYVLMPLTSQQARHEFLRRLGFELLVVRSPFVRTAMWYNRMFSTPIEQYNSQGFEPVGFFCK